MANLLNETVERRHSELDINKGYAKQERAKFSVID